MICLLIKKVKQILLTVRKDKEAELLREEKVQKTNVVKK
jgi:hypothetical protein